MQQEVTDQSVLGEEHLCARPLEELNEPIKTAGPGLEATETING